MILHLSPSGVPTGWSVTALYAASYGVALASAIGWRDKTDTAQVLIEIEGGSVRRSEMLWSKRHEDKQYPDQIVHLQTFDDTFKLDGAIVDLVAEHITSMLKEIGFLIPRDEWERRYPASHLVSQRFSEWHEACRQAGSGGIKWHPRWAMMMEAPEGWTPDFVVTEDGLGVRPVDPATDDPTEGYRFDDASSAENAMRSMNSGFTFEEALVLQKREPVDEPELAPASPHM